MPTRQIHRPGLGQRIRRLFLLPTGKRRAPRRIVPADLTVIPPKPLTLPPVPADLPELAPDRTEVFDAVMRRIGSRSLETAGRIPGPRPSEAPEPPASAPKPKPAVVPHPRTGKVLLKDAPTQPIPMVKTAALPAPSETLLPTPPRPELTPDEFLVTQGWERLFDAAIMRTDVVSFSVLSDGSLRRCEVSGPEHAESSEITAEAVPDPVAHVCRTCLNLSSGEYLGGHSWMCGTCRNVGEY